MDTMLLLRLLGDGIWSSSYLISLHSLGACLILNLVAGQAMALDIHKEVFHTGMVV